MSLNLLVSESVCWSGLRPACSRRARISQVLPAAPTCVMSGAMCPDGIPAGAPPSSPPWGCCPPLTLALRRLPAWGLRPLWFLPMVRAEPRAPCGPGGTAIRVSIRLHSCSRPHTPAAHQTVGSPVLTASVLLRRRVLYFGLSRVLVLQVPEAACECEQGLVRAPTACCPLPAPCRVLTPLLPGLTVHSWPPRPPVTCPNGRWCPQRASITRGYPVLQTVAQVAHRAGHDPPPARLP